MCFSSPKMPSVDTSAYDDAIAKQNEILEQLANRQTEFHVDPIELPEMPPAYQPLPAPPPAMLGADAPVIGRDRQTGANEGAGRTAGRGDSTSKKNRGVSALRIDLNVPNSGGSSTGSGLQIPKA